MQKLPRHVRVVLDTNILISAPITQDMLSLRAVEGIPLVTARQALERLHDARSEDNR